MGSLHAAFYSKETTDKLGYSSLVQDEIARKAKEFTLPKSPRFGGARDIRNGNILPLVVESERDHAGPLSPTMRVNTNTRTQFQDAFYESHVGIAEHVSSPNFKSSVMKQTGHLSMDCMSPTDPRQQTVRSAHNPNVGPGFYEADPMHTHTTGMASYHPAESHHMLAFAKDPARPSPAFLAQNRESKDPRVGETLDTTAIAYLPPDYESWSKGGVTMSKQPRVIQSERWGANVRELKAPPNDLFYDPQVTSDGRAATCSAYSAAPTTPAYRRAFHSGLPRLMAIPGGRFPDTRLSAKDHTQLSSTPPTAGPGSYALEPPRFRSFNAAYSQAQNYHSLASESGQQRHPHPNHPHHQQHQRSTSPGTSSPSSRGGGGGSGVSIPSSGRTSRLQPTTMSLPSSPAGTTRGGLGAYLGSEAHLGLGATGPLGQVEGGADGPAVSLSAEADWLVHQALMRSHFTGDGSRLPAQASEGGLGAEQEGAAGLGGDASCHTPDCEASASAGGDALAASPSESGPVGEVGGEGAAGTAPRAEGSSRHLASETSLKGDALTVGWSGRAPGLASLLTGEEQGRHPERAHSAPPSPVFLPNRRPPSRFDNLAFLRRATPYNKLVKAHLNAAADLKQARRLMQGQQ